MLTHISTYMRAYSVAALVLSALIRAPVVFESQYIPHAQVSRSWLCKYIQLCEYIHSCVRKRERERERVRQNRIDCARVCFVYVQCRFQLGGEWDQ